MRPDEFLGKPVLRRSPPAARVRRRQEAGISSYRDLRSKQQGTRQDLMHPDVRGGDILRRQSAQSSRTIAWVPWCCSSPLQAGALDFLDMVVDQAQPRHVALQLGQGARIRAMVLSSLVVRPLGIFLFAVGIAAMRQ